MSSIDWNERRLACPHCGNRYLPPWREGAFRCGVCGTRLPARSRFAAFRVAAARALIPGAVIVLALVFAGMQWSRPAASTGEVIRVRSSAETIPWLPDEPQRRQASEAARLRRALREKPEASGPYVAMASAIYDEVRLRAEERMPQPSPGDGIIGRPRLRWERDPRWELALERLIARQFAGSLTPGLRYAEQAVRRARAAPEEIEARATRAMGLLLQGEYARAREEYAPLFALDPWRFASPYARTFHHLNEPVPEPVREVLTQMQMMPFGGRDRAASSQQLRARLAATEQWEQRWPRDYAIQLHLGYLCYRLGTVSALEQGGLSSPGPDSYQRLDALVYRRSPTWIDRGLRHYQRAASLAKEPWERGQALEEVAHGQLIQGRPREAIETLRRALSLAPDLPLAGSYLRLAFERTRDALTPPANENPEAFPSGFGLEGPEYGWAPPAGMRLRPTRRFPRPKERILEASRLLRELDATAGDAGVRSERRQELLNRLDEVVPGCATGHDPVTGNVLDVERARVLHQIDRWSEQIEAANSPPLGPGGPSFGFGGPAGSLPFRP